MEPSCDIPSMVTQSNSDFYMANMIVDFDGAVGENPINLTKNSQGNEKAQRQQLVPESYDCWIDGTNLVEKNILRQLYSIMQNECSVRLNVQQQKYQTQRYGGA